MTCGSIVFEIYKHLSWTSFVWPGHASLHYNNDLIDPFHNMNRYVPAVQDSKRALDEYTSDIFMGGRNTIAMHNTCEDSLLVSVSSSSHIHWIYLFVNSKDLHFTGLTSHSWPCNTCWVVLPHHILCGWGKFWIHASSIINPEVWKCTSLFVMCTTLILRGPTSIYLISFQKLKKKVTCWRHQLSLMGHLLWMLFLRSDSAW